MKPLKYAFPKTPRIEKVLKQEHIHQEWKHLDAIIQEKIDGANVGIYIENDNLILQSHHYYLEGHEREHQFDLFKSWAHENSDYFKNILGNKYVLFGEWMYAKHHVFYDNLKHYFIAFDLYDKKENKFISSSRLQFKLTGCPFCIAPIIYRAKFGKINNFSQYIGPSQFKTKNWKQKLSPEELKYSDTTDLMEGIYVRVENNDWVIGRMKHSRKDFVKIMENDSEWMTRPIVPNRLRKHD